MTQKGAYRKGLSAAGTDRQRVAFNRTRLLRLADAVGDALRATVYVSPGLYRIDSGAMLRLRNAHREALPHVRDERSEAGL